MTTLVHGKLNQKSNKIAVIMAGGSGTRFWPLSRNDLPKQYLSFSEDGSSLIQETYSRLKSLVDDVLVVTSINQVELVKKHLPDVSILVEPCAKNTAGCVAYASLFIEKSCPNVTTIFLPADHKIIGKDEFAQVCSEAIELANSISALVTIGIVPSRPETGYGYIKKGSKFSNYFKVDSFVEKPNHETAKKYFQSGEYFWNSGIFSWKNTTILDSLEKYAPDILKSLNQIFSSGVSLTLESAGESFSKMPSLPIDTAVMEKADNVIVVPGDGFYWSDIGSWQSWMETEEISSENNLIKGDVISIDTKGCGIVGKDRLIATIGVEDLVIVDTEDAILVCKKDRSQDVKKIVEMLKEKGRSSIT